MADEDAIYVDVIPRLDEAAADEAEEKLRDKFKDVAKDIGENLKDGFNNLGDHVKDIFNKDNIRETIGNAREHIGDALGSELGKEITGGIRKTIEDELGYTVNDALTGIGKNVGGYIGESLRDAIGGENIDRVLDKVDMIKDKFHGITDALKAFKENDISGGLSGLSGLFGGVEDLNNLSTIALTVESLSQSLKEVWPGLPALAGLGGPLTTMATIAAGGAYGVSQLDKNVVNKELYTGYNEFLQQGGGRLVNGKPPSITEYARALSSHSIPTLFPYAPGEGGEDVLATLLDNPNSIGDVSTPGPIVQPKPNEVLLPIPGGSIGTRGPEQERVGPAAPAAAPPAASTVTHAQSALVEAGTATISAGSVSLGGLSLPSVVQYVPGSAGSGNVSGPPSHGTSSSGFGSGAGRSSGSSAGGGLGDLLGAGHAAGGQVLPGDSPGFDNLLGMLPGGRPIGLEGGEFVVNPGATQSNLGLLQAINASDHFDMGGLLGGGTDVHESGGPLQSVLGGGGSQGKPNAAGQGPGAATSPMKAAGEPSPAQTIIPQGQGKGFGISGGILGGAEGAAAGAADMFAPGSGAAVQIGMQEANRAIEFGVKAGITAGIEAPLDTFWLSDSGLADPSHSWFGKLGLNLIGKTGGALQQNLAGLTQAPLTPGQGQGSPLGGQQKEAGPSIHIENQHNYSDTDHEANNRSLVNQMGAYQY